MMELFSALIALGSLPSAVLAVSMAYKLGRGAAREDRLRAQQLDSIADTRDRMLDVVRLGEALASLTVRDVTAIGDLLASLRYGRARNVLMADDRLIDELTKTIPALLRACPNATYELRSDIGKLGNVVREAMFDQEIAVLKTGKPLPQSDEQKNRIDAMMDDLAEVQERFSGWSGLRIRLVIFRRVTFGF